MRHVLSRSETYRFTCRRCSEQWEQEYQVEYWMDAEGDEHVVCTIDGVVTPPPWSGVACLGCSGSRVDVVRCATAGHPESGPDLPLTV
jgi:hypothetical protein